MVRVFIGAGSNLGDREALMAEALRMLKGLPGMTFRRASPVYETEPMGGPPQGKYLNAVWELETSQDCRNLLGALLRIEKALGRERTGKNAPRTMDLDILFYGDNVYDLAGLSVPHPRLHERRFVLRPMADLAPEWIHPGLNKTVRQLLEELDERNPQS